MFKLAFDISVNLFRQSYRFADIAFHHATQVMHLAALFGDICGVGIQSAGSFFEGALAGAVEGGHQIATQSSVLFQMIEQRYRATAAMIHFAGKLVGHLIGESVDRVNITA